MTTESKSVSLGLCRFETCRLTGFLRNTSQRFAHEWFPWGIYLDFVLAKVVDTTESKSVEDGAKAGSKPAGGKVFLLLNTP
jgi:hypothetical protein